MTKVKLKFLALLVMLLPAAAGHGLLAQSDDDAESDALRRILRDAMSAQPDVSRSADRFGQTPSAPAPSTTPAPVPALAPDPAPTETVPGASASPSPTPAGAAPPAVTAPGATTPFPETAADPNAPTDMSEMSVAGGDELIGVEVLRFNNMPLEQFLDFYANFRQRTLLRPGNLPLTQQVTLKARTPLTRREAVEAMDTVLAMNGITIIPVGEKFVKAVVAADALKEGAAFTEVDRESMPEASQYVTQIVQLQHIDPAEAVQVIEPFANNAAGIVSVESSRVLVLRDYAINVKRMLEVLEKIDVEVPMDLISEVIPIKYALATDIAQVLGTLTSTGDVAAPVGGGSIGGTARGGVNRSSSSLNRGGSSLGRGTSSSGYRTNTRGVGQLQRATTPTTSRTGSSFQQRLQQIVSRASSTGETEILGEVKIIPDERTNSILVFASKRDLEMIKDIVDKLDVVLAQVLIEAIIMEVSLSNGFDLGVSAFQHPQTSGKFTGTGAMKNGQDFLGASTNLLGAFPSGFSYLGQFNNEFDVAVTAIARDSNINVISRPRIQTSHAVPASFRIGDTVPYITGSTFGDFGTIGSRSSYSQLFVGVDLQVTPLINVDGLVVMEIEQVIEQLGPPQIIDGNEVPTTTSREAFATVAVRDRDTIILGGFIKSDKSQSRSGVPILKDIPLLGALFRSSSDSRERTEMIVLMRPTVLPTPEAAALAAKEEQINMPSVREADEEYQKAAQGRRDRFNRRRGLK